MTLGAAEVVVAAEVVAVADANSNLTAVTGSAVSALNLATIVPVVPPSKPAPPVNVEPGASVVKGPYVAETIAVSVESDYVVVDL